MLAQNTLKRSHCFGSLLLTSLHVVIEVKATAQYPFDNTDSCFFPRSVKVMGIWGVSSTIRVERSVSTLSLPSETHRETFTSMGYSKYLSFVMELSASWLLFHTENIILPEPVNFIQFLIDSLKVFLRDIFSDVG